MAAPIEITLYDPETNEVRQTHSRSFIPWKILKAALRLQAKLGDGENISEEVIDEIAGLVTEVFGNQFSVNDLSEGADVGEMITVIRAIVARASALMGESGNPTKRG